MTVGDALIEAASRKGIVLTDRLSMPAAHCGPHRYLFHHMPKAGGTSVRSVLQDWFTVHPDYREGWTTKVAPAFDLDALGPDDLVSGHFELPETRIATRYPSVLGNPEWRVFTFVRDPLELALSNHFFENTRRASEPGYAQRSLSQRLRESSDYVTHFEYDADNWREILDRYWFIGTMDRLEEGLHYIADTIGKPMPMLVPRLNATHRSEKPDPADVDAFARRNALDYAVYNEIRARLARRLGG
jgi:hypothetical protein